MSWTVADVMTRDVVTVEPSTPVMACAATMRLHGIAALPVVTGERVVGMVTDTDLGRDGRIVTVRERYAAAAANHRGAGTSTASDVMTAPAVTTAPDCPIAAAARFMFQRRLHRLPVVDEGHHLVGIVSSSDLLRVFLRSDESIRREVAEELSRDVPSLWRGWILPRVHGGVVTLSGEVEAGALTGLLLRLVAAVPGVVGVKNDLAVVPASSARTVPERRELSLARP